MDLGKLYAARAGTPPPPMTVKDGRFVDTWDPAAWVLVAFVDEIRIDSSGSSFLRNVLNIDVTPHGRWSGLFADLAQGPLMLAYESGNRTDRFMFTQINKITAIRTKGAAQTTMRFEVPREHMRAYVAGPLSTSNTLTVPSVATPAPSAPYGGKAAELVPGRLRGYREWVVMKDPDGGPPRLAAITAGTVWPWTPVFEARCQRGEIVATGKYSFGPAAAHDPADVPNAECSCGIYAKHKPLGNIGPGHGRVFGVIEAWGKVELGTNGFRAQKARLVALGGALPDTMVVKMASSWNDLLTIGDPQPIGIGDETMSALGELYRVPTFAAVADMWEEYPPGDVVELLGTPPEPKREFHQGGYISGPGSVFAGPVGGMGPYRHLGYVSGSFWAGINALGT